MTGGGPEGVMVVVLAWAHSVLIASLGKVVRLLRPDTNGFSFVHRRCLFVQSNANPTSPVIDVSSCGVTTGLLESSPHFGLLELRWQVESEVAEENGLVIGRFGDAAADVRAFAGGPHDVRRTTSIVRISLSQVACVDAE